MYGRTIGLIAALIVALLPAGCARAPAGSESVKAPTQALGQVLPPAKLGAYPAAPPASEMRIRWQRTASRAWRTVVRQGYQGPPGGRISVDLDGSRLAYAEARAAKGDPGGAHPNTVLLQKLGAAPKTVLRLPAGMVVESVRLSYPWLVRIERPSSREWDWRLVALNLENRTAKAVARGSETGLAEEQFVPSPALDGRLLTWDQRVRRHGRPANVIRACDLGSGRATTVDGSGNEHIPDVHDGRIIWNEEIMSQKAGRVAVRSDLFAAVHGGGRRRLTRTGFAMFASIGRRTLVWLDLRRGWLDQPAISNVYCRWDGGRATKVTSTGLVDRALAGDGIVGWQDALSGVCVVDLRSRRGWRLTRGTDDAVLCDVDGRRVAYEIQPNPMTGRNGYELAVLELKG